MFGNTILTVGSGAITVGAAIAVPNGWPVARERGFLGWIILAIRAWTGR